MAISNISITPPASSPVSSVISNAPTRDKPSVDRQASASVTLSAQGQQLSQSQAPSSRTPVNRTQASSTVNTPAAPNVVPQNKETAHAPGIQFVSGESKGGRVNTFA